MKIPTPEEIIESNVVNRLQYRLDDEGRTHVTGVPGIGSVIRKALIDYGYAITQISDHRPPWETR